MKLMKYSWLAALPMIFTACQEDALVENQHQDKWISSLTAQVGQSVQSRAQILLNNPVSGDELFYWNEGDCFSIYQAKDNYYQRSEFQISSNYTEPENGLAAVSAEFSTETPVSSSENFVATYPDWNRWSWNDERIDINIETWLDFSQSTPDEVWTEYFKHNMVMIAEGNFDQMETPAVNFRHLCALARITYVNHTGLDQKIEAFSLSGGQGFDMSYAYNLEQGKGESYNTNSMSQIWTRDLVVAAGETTDLYMLFFPKSFGEGVMDITLKFENEEYKSVQIPISKIADANPGADGFEAGKRYWFKLTDGASQGLVWSYEYNKVEAPEGTIVFENPGFSKALYKCWGDNNQVGLDYRGYAFMLPEDVLEIKELDFGWQNHYVTSWSGIEYFENLEIFTCANSNVENADFSKNTRLRRVSISNNPITSLDFSNCPDLEHLDCSYQEKLTSLNLDGCTQLNNLQLERTGLKSLDVPEPSEIQIFNLPAGLTIDFAEYPNLGNLGLQARGLTDLTMIPTDVKQRLYYLNVQNNQLTTIDLSEFPQLTGLDCSYNQLTALDVSVRPKLTQLYTYANNMDALDVSSLRNLEWLYCGLQNNERTLVLNLTKEQKINWDLNWSNDTWGNANVTLNEVEGPADPDITFTNTELANVLYSVLGGEKVTLNDDRTAVMKQSDVEDVTSLDFGWQNYTVTSLEGIEHFVNLEHLGCGNVGLQTCDLSQNTALMSVDLSNNKLSTIDFSANSNLRSIYLHFNENLNNLDLSNSPQIQVLNVSHTALNELILPNPQQIDVLDIGHTQLTGFDLSKFNSITRLVIENLQLDNLDFIPTQVRARLRELECQMNNITTISASDYPELTNLNCSENKMTALDITSLKKMNDLKCGNQKDNQTLILTLTDEQKIRWNDEWSKNEYENRKVRFYDFVDRDIVIENPGLAVALQDALGIDMVTIDSETGYALMKESDVLEVRNLEFGWEENKYDISTLKGIENFTNLEVLYCNYTGLKEYDLHQNTKLKWVVLCGNLLTSMDLSYLPELEYVGCASSQNLQDLVLTNCTKLNHVECQGTLLETIDIPNPENMDQLICGGNPNLNVDLTPYTKLTILGLQSMGLTQVNIPNELKTQLTWLSVQGNDLTSFNVAEYPNLTAFSCDNNKMEILDITPLSKLEHFSCGWQKLEDEKKLVLTLTQAQEALWNSSWYVNHDESVTLNVVP